MNEENIELAQWRFLHSLSTELHIETIRLYPKSVGYGGRYYVVDVNRTIPIE